MPPYASTSGCRHARGQNAACVSPWAHGIDADTVPGVFHGRLTRQADNAMVAGHHEPEQCPASPRPTTDDMLTMTPPPCLSICGIAYFMHNQTPVRLVRMVRSQSSSGMSAVGTRLHSQRC